MSISELDNGRKTLEWKWFESRNSRLLISFYLASHVQQFFSVFFCFFVTLWPGRCCPKSISLINPLSRLNTVLHFVICVRSYVRIFLLSFWIVSPFVFLLLVALRFSSVVGAAVCRLSFRWLPEPHVLMIEFGKWTKIKDLWIECFTGIIEM